METRSPLPTFFDRNQDPYCSRRDLEFIYRISVIQHSVQPANSNSRVANFKARCQSIAHRDLSTLASGIKNICLPCSIITQRSMIKLVREKGLSTFATRYYPILFSEMRHWQPEIRMPWSCPRFDTRIILTNVYALPIIVSSMAGILIVVLTGCSMHDQSINDDDT